jgi:DNA-binding Xre family transcriptional regulator
MRLRLAEILKENKRKGRKPATAYQLAQLTGLSISTASRLVRDEWQCLPRDVLAKLCESLGKSPAELLEYIPDKPKRRLA